MTGPEIIVVYNADSGLWNGSLDLLHKNVSPESYACSLCALTYNNLGMRSRWRNFVASLPYDARFLHRDELADEFQLVNVALPAAYLHRDGTLDAWLTAEDFNRRESLDALIQLLQARAADL